MHRIELHRIALNRIALHRIESLHRIALQAVQAPRLWSSVNGVVVGWWLITLGAVVFLVTRRPYLAVPSKEDHLQQSALHQDGAYARYDR